MRLARPNRPLPVVSIVPLVDVLLILLIFFMVTSTFLNLDMVPLVERESGRQNSTTQQGLRTILLRILPNGDVALGGRILPARQLAETLRGRINEMPNAQLLILPSAQADVQALVTLLDIVAELGIPNAKVVRFGEPE